MTEVSSLLGSLTPEQRELLLLELAALEKERQGPRRAAIPRRHLAGPVPVSCSQRGLWFFAQWAPGQTCYHLTIPLTCRGGLQVPSLIASLGELTRRHEALRTTFAAPSGEPLQVVAPPAPVPLPVVDLRQLPPAARQTAAEQILTDWETRPFDLEGGPLLRALLLALDPPEHRLSLVFHHIVVDGWSTGIVCDELAALYSAAAAGRPWPLPELPIQYADYAVWQRERLETGALREALEHFRRQLDGAPALQALPADRPRPAVQSHRGAALAWRMPPRLAAALQDLARRRGATLFMVLLAAFDTLLHRFTGQDDLVVATPFANRDRPELEPLIGLLVNLVVIRGDLSGDPPFAGLLERLRRVTSEAYAHHELPFELLVEELCPARDRSHTPFTQVVLQIEDAGKASWELPGLTLEPLSRSRSAVQFELILTVFQEAGGLLCSLEYGRDLFDGSTITRLVRHYGVLLQAVTEQPDCRLSELPLMDEAERHQLLREWNGTAESPPRAVLHELCAEQARLRPEAVAVTGPDGSLSYGELDRRATGLARRLLALGVRPEERVGLLASRSCNLLVGLLAILKAGAAYVPLDPVYPRQRLSLLLEDAGIRTVVSDGSGPAGLGVLVSLDGAGEPPSGGPDLPAVASGQLAYVIYTSGSTGRPKGVLVAHAQAVRLFTVTWDWFRFGPGDVWSLFHSCAFDFSVWEIWGALLHGGRVAVVPQEATRSPEAFAELLARQGVTVLSQTPSAFQMLSEHLRLRRSLPSSLRLVVFGGEALAPAMLAPWFDAFGDRMPLLVNMYGITETTVHVTYRPLRREDASAAAGSRVGRPIPDLRVYLVDPALHSVPLGAAGELAVGGEGVARGYLGRPGLTAERFVPDPFAERPGARLYRSGDLARWRPDGDLEYLGRLDHQLKIRGHRIEPAEVTGALGRHPGVRSAVVAALGGLEGRSLAAWFIPKGSPEPTPEELRRFLREHLPDPMVPSVYISVPAFPLTRNGKVDLAALPAPEARPTGERVLPRTPVEAALTEAWAEVLHLERVGVRDNFFTLGGDSIRTLHVRLAAEKRGLVLSVPELFEHQTIEDLAAHLAARDRLPWAPAAAVEPFALLTPGERERLPQDLEDAYPVAALQAGMLYHGDLDAESALYHDVFSYHVRAPFAPELLRAALAPLVERHPVLRTSFELAGFREPLQLVHRQVEVPVTVEEDWRALSQAEQEQRLADWLDGECRRRFDPARPPLLRLALHRRSEDTFQLTLVFHHAILDGWSVSRLLTDLLRSYLDLWHGREPAPPAPALPYRELVAEERNALAAEEPRLFWARLVAGAPTTLPPGRTPAADAPMVRGDLPVPLDARTSESLLSRCEEHGLPLKSLLLAVHLEVLGRLTGSDDVITGVVSHGRLEREGGAEALGLYLNSLPFRLWLGSGSWLDLARRTAALEGALLPHRRFPMAEIQRASGGRPLFETLFNFVHFHVAADLLQSQEVELLGEVSRDETNFPLVAQLSRSPVAREVSLRLLYDRRRWSHREVTLFAERYRRALEAAAENPLELRERAALLSRAELHGQLVEWNDSRLFPAPEEGPERLHLAFERQAAATPGAPALAWEGGTLTYAELDRWAGRLARRLVVAGAGPEVAVGLYLERSPAMVATLLGILKSGAAFLPLDPAYPRQRTAAILEDADVPLVLTQADLTSDLATFAGAVLLVAASPASEPAAPEISQPGLPPALGGESLAYLIYTSGSTGRPKPVAVSHRAAVRHLTAMRRALALRPSDRVLQFATLSFDASLDQIFPALSEGACLVVRGARLWSPRELQEKVEELGLTVLNLPTAYWSEWARVRSEDPPTEAGDPVRLVYAGGEAMPLAALESWRACPRNRGVRLLNVYGVTEAVITSSWLDISGGAPGGVSGLAPIGRSLGGRALYVLAPSGLPLPAGAPGELYLGGPLARGYPGRPDLTAERFVPDPFGDAPGGVLYRTGDLVRFLDDGRVEYLGRLDRQLKVRGIRIEPGEVEAALRAYPGVRDAVVEARGYPTETRLVAWVVCAPGTGEADLRNAARRRLPEAMVPTTFAFLEALPLTLGGKVDRAALPDPGLDAGRAAASVPPRTETEKLLCDIWGDVFDRTEIGVEDDFFALGGHSIRAAQILARIRKAFRLDLPLRSLFERPTIAALGAVIDWRQLEAAQPAQVERLLAELEDLSDDEIAMLLEAEEGAEENGSSRR